MTGSHDVFQIAALCHALCPVLHLESAEDGGHSAVQGVPAPVALVDHGFELACSVSAVLPGKAAVLVVDKFQLGQPLVDLPLETLKKEQKKRDDYVSKYCSNTWRTEGTFVPQHPSHNIKYSCAKIISRLLQIEINWILVYNLLGDQKEHCEIKKTMIDHRVTVE